MIKDKIKIIQTNQHDKLITNASTKQTWIVPKYWLHQQTCQSHQCSLLMSASYTSNYLLCAYAYKFILMYNLNKLNYELF
jgi:Ni,Fe-hydrogenase I small subunit